MARELRHWRDCDSPGVAMPILTVRHATTYEYRRPVAFGAHTMMLRPRDDADQRLIGETIEILPRPRRVAWRRDAFGNHVAVADFADRADALRFTSTIRLAVAPLDFDAVPIAGFARRARFDHTETDRAVLSPFLDAGPPDPAVLAWARGFLDADGSADTRALLKAMTATIRRTIRHVARHEPGVQTPAETLHKGSGCCRDVAVLMIAAVRALGFAARFVSGYLRVRGADDAHLTGGNTHAWAQVHVPGPGWVDFDPASGTVGNRDLVRVAVVDDPGAAVPVHGTYFGDAADHVGMTVAVAVIRDGTEGVPTRD
jgi:transglutaminase-like putative cysteine protease